MLGGRKNSKPENDLKMLQIGRVSLQREHRPSKAHERLGSPGAGAYYVGRFLF
jgi:hypothetical protein